VSSFFDASDIVMIKFGEMHLSHLHSAPLLINEFKLDVPWITLY